jgi:hypothetical protein
MEKSNPITDITDYLNLKAREGRKTPVASIGRVAYDAILERTGCKDSAELLAAYRKKYPYQTQFTITIIE